MRVRDVCDRRPVCVCLNVYVRQARMISGRIAQCVERLFVVCAMRG